MKENTKETRLELYMKFTKNIMKEENLSKISLMDMDTFKEYEIELKKDKELYIKSIDDMEAVTYEIFESLIKDYLVSKILDAELSGYSFLEDQTLYAISIDKSSKIIMETYERTVYDEILEISLDKS
jgi:hypothetical protein